METTYDDFLRMEIRVGKIVEAEPFPQAKNPSFKLTIDFGAYGIKRSSAQITELYGVRDLVGTHVAAVTNFPPKRVAGFSSEVLVLGAVRERGGVVLLRPDRDVEPGTRVL
jgi:tRNA-binding protein